MSGDRRPMPQDMVQELALALETAASLSKVLEVLVLSPPLEGSPAYEDAPLRFGHEVGRFASLGLGTGIDHMTAWRLMLESGTLPQKAWATLARSVVEGAVTCLWVLDGDSKVRRARAAQLQLADYQNRRRFEADMQIPAAAFDASGKPAAVREREHIAEMAKEGVERRRIDTSALFRDYAVPSPEPPDEGRGRYRLVSAFAHGMEWAMATMEVVEQREGFGADQRLVKMTAADATIVGVAQWASDALTRAADALTAYQGR